MKILIKYTKISLFFLFIVVATFSSAEDKKNNVNYSNKYGNNLELTPFEIKQDFRLEYKKSWKGATFEEKTSWINLWQEKFEEKRVKNEPWKEAQKLYVDTNEDRKSLREEKLEKIRKDRKKKKKSQLKKEKQKTKAKERRKKSALKRIKEQNKKMEDLKKRQQRRN
ncbi:MAG: hypothetical protein ACI9F2_000948 [Lysobacterales bacterium]|jgi:hypothetical protein